MKISLKLPIHNFFKCFPNVKKDLRVLRKNRIYIRAIAGELRGTVVRGPSKIRFRIFCSLRFHPCSSHLSFTFFLLLLSTYLFFSPLLFSMCSSPLSSVFFLLHFFSFVTLASFPSPYPLRPSSFLLFFFSKSLDWFLVIIHCPPCHSRNCIRYTVASQIIKFNLGNGLMRMTVRTTGTSISLHSSE